MELKSRRASISYLTSQNIWLSIFFFFKNTVVLNYFFYLILTLSERPNIVRVRKGQGRLVYNLSPHAINLSDIIYRQTIATHDTGSRRKKFEEKNTENMQGNW